MIIIFRYKMMSLEELKEFIQQSTTPLKTNPQLPTPLNTPPVGKYFYINQKTIFYQKYSIKIY
jgi:hypothetical protein